MNQQNWGGKRDNAGRNPIHDDPKKPKSFRLSPYSIDRLEQLAALWKCSQAEVLETLLDQPFQVK